MAAAMLNKAARAKVLAALRCFDEATVKAAMACIPVGYHAWAHGGLRQGRTRCQGINGEPCVFAATSRPTAVKVQGRRRHCVFCDTEALAAACQEQSKREDLLEKMARMGHASRAAALARIPDNHKAEFPEVHDAAWAHDGMRQGRARCLGMNGDPCVFAATSRPTAVEVKGRRRHCVFCDTEALAAACQEQSKREDLLEKMTRMGHASRAAALARIPDNHKAEFREVIDTPLRPALRVLRRPAASVDAAPVAPQEMERRSAAGVAAWVSVLAKRKSCKAAPGRSAQKKYREKILDDRARARRRLGRPKERTPRGAAVTNDTSLPPAKRSRRACDLEQWCKFNSWSTCPRCSMLWERPLTERTLGANLPAQLPKACRICEKNGKAPDDAVDCFVPSPDDVPLQLRGLSQEAREALCPLVSDVGPEVRAENNTGYRQHATMIRFSWHARSVKHRIRPAVTTTCIPSVTSRTSPYARTHTRTNEHTHARTHEHTLKMRSPRTCYSHGAREMSALLQAYPRRRHAAARRGRVQVPPLQ